VDHRPADARVVSAQTKIKNRLPAAQHAGAMATSTNSPKDKTVMAPMP
jgi:hypothetical protein